MNTLPAPFALLRSPGSYELVGWTCLALLLAFCALLWWRGREEGAEDRKGLLWSLGYLLLGALVLLAWRWPMLFYPLFLNPDEAQGAAGGLTLLQDPVFWRSVDASTNGPLVVYALALLQWMGVEPLMSARLASLLLCFGVFASVFTALRLMLPLAVSCIAALPVLLFFALAVQADFLFYSSELVPLFFLAASLVPFVVLQQGRGRRLWRHAAFLGLLLGSVPYAKLQAMPLAVVMWLAAAAMLVFSPETQNKVKLRNGAALVLGTLFTPMCFLGLVLAGGVFHDFYISYIVDNLHYVEAAKTYSKSPLDSSGLFDAVFFRDFVLFGNAQWAYYLLPHAAFCLIAGLCCVIRGRARNWPMFLTLAALLCAGLVAVLLPARAFPHYLLFLVLPVGALAGGLLGCSLTNTPDRPARGNRSLQFSLVLLFFLGCVAPQVLYRVQNSLPYFNETLFSSPPPHPISRIANTVLRPGESMSVWGWRPDYYIYANAPMATRDGQTQRQIHQNPHLDYYRQRHLNDLREEMPILFVDATGPMDFFFKDRARHGIEIFPALHAFIQEHYTKVAEFQQTRIYVDSERLQTLQQRTSSP